MQMFLQHQPGTSYPDDDPFSPTNVGDEADTVYHEYTHGLSNRLVVDASGAPTLGDVQAGAMGEAWSDWYAMDYLVAQGLQADKAGTADIVLFQYDGAGTAVDRTEPIDCKVGDNSAAVHRRRHRAHGRLHLRRLRQHRRRPRGARRRRDLGTDPVGPARRARLVEDRVAGDPGHGALAVQPVVPRRAQRDPVAGHRGVRRPGPAAIWKVFADRGMGYFAGSLGGDDTTPGADFHTPPAGPAPRHHRHGDRPGHRQADRRVHGDPGLPGRPGAANPSAVTGADGRYRIGSVPVGTYPKLVATGPGYDPASSAVTVDQWRHQGLRRPPRTRRPASGGGIT